MRIQDYTTDLAAKNAEEAFRYAKSVPADKLTWSPLDLGRTVISQCQELAMCPSWGVQVLGEQDFKHSEEESKSAQETMAEWTTVEACHENFKKNFEEYSKIAKGLSDEDLKKTKWLPFDGGRDFTYAELLEYVGWNCTYHLGQVAYVQTLYGDKEMH